MTKLTLLVAAGITLGACSSSSGVPAVDGSHPTAQDAYDTFVTTYCKLIVSCCANGELTCQPDFDEVKCEQAFEQTLSGTETCTYAEVDACSSDVKNQSCTALDPSALKLPSSCQKC